MQACLGRKKESGGSIRYQAFIDGLASENNDSFWAPLIQNAFSIAFVSVLQSLTAGLTALLLPSVHAKKRKLWLALLSDNKDLNTETYQ